MIATLLFLLACSTIALVQAADGGGIIYSSEIGVMVAAPNGWVFDTKSGLSQRLQVVMYPTGSTWATANEMMYVNIANNNEALDLFIAGDIESFKKNSPRLTVEKALP
jgi:hypothetical protein